MFDKIQAIILSGGHSSRMGTPKALLNYHGLPQYKHLQNLLTSLGLEVYLSCREEQKALFQGISMIFDLEIYQNNGPMSGVLSCMEQLSSSLLVVGCDYPYITASHIEKLLSKRDMVSSVVGFVGNNTGIEPLNCIYEFDTHKPMKNAFLDGQTSLFKFVRKVRSAGIVLNDLESLKSFDTQAEFEECQKKHASLIK